jgi:hypothetical protein
VSAEVVIDDAVEEIILAALEAAYHGWLDSLDDHGGSYSDMHVRSQAQMQASVTYTYDSPAAAAVPEPATLTLLGVGLGGLGYRRRNRARFLRGQSRA